MHSMGLAGHPGSLFMAKMIEDNLKKEKDLDDDEEDDEIDDEKPSAWLVTPYFCIYLMSFTINTLVWPLMLLERSCIFLVTDDKMINTLPEKVSNSCVNRYISNVNHSDIHVDSTYRMTLYSMIAITFMEGLVSFLSYFLIWKPMMTKFPGISLIMPPVAVMCQSLLLMQSLKETDFFAFRFALATGLILPCLHGGIHGVFLLLFHMKDGPTVETKRKLSNVKIDGSNAIIFASMSLGGFIVAYCFDMSYALIFFIQFTFGSVNLMYGLTLMPTEHSLMTGKEIQPDDKDIPGDGNGIEGEDDDSSTSSVEEFLLADAVKEQKEKAGLWSKQMNVLREVPMIFSDQSYKMELIIVIEVCVFTIAMVGDTGISSFYFLETPFHLDIRVFGWCVVAQGVIKIIGVFLVKAVIRFTQIKYGTLVAIALINYIAYYVILSFASTKLLIIAVMFTNVFGGLGLLSIFSFIKINLRQTDESVLELCMIESILVTMLVNCLKIYVYERTRDVFPGAVFALIASLLLVCGILILAAYFSTAKKHQRKAKSFADKLLNSEH